MLSYYLKEAYHWLFPFTCLLCGRANKIFGVCRSYRQELPWAVHGCQRCANPVLSISSLCGKCLQKPPIYDDMLALFYYRSPIDHLLTSLKFSNQLIYAQLLGQLLAEHIKNHYLTRPKPELIIPMPLHASRLRQRGYNQAVELSRPIAKTMNIPLSFNQCQRIIATEPQSSIPAAARQQNVKNAFAIVAPISAKHVAIVDDIVTTGSTVDELIKILHRSGVTTIDLWCCARTVLD